MWHSDRLVDEPSKCTGPARYPGDFVRVSICFPHRRAHARRGRSHRRVARQPRHAVEVGVAAGQVRQWTGLHNCEYQAVADLRAARFVCSGFAIGASRQVAGDGHFTIRATVRQGWEIGKPKWRAAASTPSAILKGSVREFVEGWAMSLAEVLPKVQSLSRQDKVRLIQLLAQDLEREAGGLIEPGRSYPLPSPDRAFSAAATLLQALEEAKRQP